MKALSEFQFKILSGFFSNMAVLWFGAAFINPSDTPSSIKYVISAIASLVLALKVGKDVK